MHLAPKVTKTSIQSLQHNFIIEIRFNYLPSVIQIRAEKGKNDGWKENNKGALTYGFASL